MNFKTLFTLLLCVGYFNINAQVTHQQTYWTRVFFRLKINDKWSTQLQLDNRRFFNENQQLQFITHAGVHRKLGKNTEASLGVSFSESWQGSLPVPEWRPYQEFYFYQPFGKLRVSHRLRTEQRWFHNYSGTNLTEGYNFKFRFRYMTRLEYKLSDKWVLRANGELMYHQDDFDQWRAYGGVEYKMLKDLSFELGYLKVYQKRANNKGYFDRDNMRITIYKDFVLVKNNVN